MAGNPHEERAREEKAKRVARAVLRAALGALPDINEPWENVELLAGVKVCSIITKQRVVEILESIAI